MNKDHITEASLDRPNKVQIVLTKYFIDEDLEFSSWECDVFYESQYIGGGTAPTQEQAYDLSNDIIFDYEHPSLF